VPATRTLKDLPIRGVRRLASAPGLRYLTRFESLLRLSFALRASLVHEKRAFAANELRRKRAVGVYRLRGSGIAVALRHHTADVMVLDEIFSQGEYEPPPEARAALSRLPRAPQVLDLGANIGLFGAWALGEMPDATIVAVEADPGNAAVHRRTIEANAFGDRWQLIEGFASTESGEVPFKAGLFATSQRAGPGEESVHVTAVDVLPRVGAADLVKIDIEGEEWDLLGDPRFLKARPQVVILEYHQQSCPVADAAEAAAEALRASGFEVVHGGSKPQFGAGILWAFTPTGGSVTDQPPSVRR
jgi:FkbM family methyltransferase